MKNGEFKNENGILFEYGTYRDFEMKYYETNIDGVTVEFHGWNRPDDDLRVVVNLPGKRWTKDTKLRSVKNITENQIREFIALSKRS